MKVLAITIFTSLSAFSFFWNKTFDDVAKDMVNKFDSPAVKLDKAQKMINDGAILLDARELNEYEVSHISGAKNVGYEKFDLKKTIKELPKNKPIIVYCSLGYRSGDIADKLNKAGFKTYNLYGGNF